MNLQKQIDTIQALKDGRRVTYISIYDHIPTRVYDRHAFDFVRNTYTVEPLYKEGEVIMVMPAVYANHRKQTPAERGES